MKKQLLSAIAILFLISPLAGQRNTDVLYLKNGSMVYGKLMEANSEQYKIKTSDGSLFIFPSAEVDRLVNDSQIFAGRKEKGAGFALEAGLLAGVKTEEYTAPFSFNMTGNYTFGKTHSFGIGSGVEFIGQSFLPLFVEYRQLFNDRKTSPYIFTRVGQLFHISGDDSSSDTYNPYNYEKNYHGGFSFTLGTGISWIRNENETYLSFAYRNAHISYDQLDYNNHNNTYKTTLNRLEVKFGFRF